MVCIYCGQGTDVINSRLQKRRNNVWRRRHCTSCGATFTSIEHADYETSLAFEDRNSHILPLSRDVLFISIYEACKHRSQATMDAAALTDTIIRKIMAEPIQNGKVTRATLLRIALQTLQSFDSAAATYYSAYHKV